MSKITWIAKMAAVCGLLFAAAVGCGEMGGDRPVIMRVASVLPPNHPSSRALTYFQERLKTLSEGEIEVRLFLGGQLGDDTETVEMCQMGNIEGVFISSATMSQYESLFNALSMPFIFRDTEHAYAVLDGPLRDVFRGKLQDVRLDLLAFYDAGSRNIMTTRGPVRTPEDLAGMKIRVMGAPLMVNSINALGASAISMGQGDVYSALQTGMLDGWENNPQTALTFKMYETGCIHFAHTRHMMIPDLLVAGKRFLGRLDEETRGWVKQAARESEAHQRELWRASEAENIDKLKEEGMLFNEVDVDLFRDRVDGVYTKYFEQYGEEFEGICRRITETE